ncbi:MAG TPA: GNAT family N-acetyltransferase [Phenylobacterium sp.]|jgi:GNAT superfamily N-acetyltransferase|uniref:GNAT family N-acetyltransferase n=1 Tax=Phenylobacterium sp. TaxID=1871053 RepID=UPI002C854AA2|nr:GNAT family N-acetyltransferase [Phenylobacterium sp.]HXA40359.1 GNAT family N-acetyltransferase [Phenylobacterium sp.]
MTKAFRIRSLSPEEAQAAAPALAAVLADCVWGGASVSFMADLTLDEAEAFWRRQATAGDGRAILAAEDDEGVFGVVQVIPAWPPNQPHRSDISKLLVHRRGRRRGAAEALMRAAEDAARAMGRPLMTLDTVTGGAADRLYGKLGWTRVGVIPDFALMPDGALSATTVFYKALRP